MSNHEPMLVFQFGDGSFVESRTKILSPTCQSLECTTRCYQRQRRHLVELGQSVCACACACAIKRRMACAVRGRGCTTNNKTCFSPSPSSSLFFPFIVVVCSELSSSLKSWICFFVFLCFLSAAMPSASVSVALMSLPKAEERYLIIQCNVFRAEGERKPNLYLQSDSVGWFGNIGGVQWAAHFRRVRPYAYLLVRVRA